MALHETISKNALGSQFVDSDGDGVDDAADQCPGFDDNLDNDNDGVPDGCDLDDDNDGILDVEEQNCSSLPNLPNSFSTPSIIEGGTRITSIITNFNGYWSSSINTVNSTFPNKSHDLLAFTTNGVTYTTGAIDDNLIDSDNNGAIDFVDTNGDGSGDIAVTPTLFKAFEPTNDNIMNKYVFESSLNDGSFGLNSIPLIGNVTSNPLNPLLTNGQRGLDLGTGIANVDDNWYYNISNLEPSAIGDGIPDIISTQLANADGMTNNLIAFFDAQGNAIGNAVRLVASEGGEFSYVVGRQRFDIRQPDGSVLDTHSQREIRMASIELSAFNIPLGQLNDIAIMRVTLSEFADNGFIAYNEASFSGICSNLDSDGDNIPNHLDIDSDNDGCYDVTEAGYADGDGDGILGSGPVTVDANGLVISGANGYAGTNESVVVADEDHDGDGLVGICDGDSDNDGISDDLDAYPNDPIRAGNVYYPSENGEATLAFEDLWPFIGDYDFNDTAIDYKVTTVTNASNQVVELIFETELVSNGGAFVNGFAFELEGVDPSLVLLYLDFRFLKTSFQ